MKIQPLQTYNNLSKCSFKNNDYVYYLQNDNDIYSDTVTIKDAAVSALIISGILIAGSAIYSNKQMIIETVKKNWNNIRNNTSNVLNIKRKSSGLNKLA